MPPSFDIILLSFLPGMERFFLRHWSLSPPNSWRCGFVSQLCPLPEWGGDALQGRCRRGEGIKPSFWGSLGFFHLLAVNFFLWDDFNLEWLHQWGGSLGCSCIPAWCCPGHPLYLLGKKGASLNPLYREVRPGLQYTSNHWGFCWFCFVFFTFDTKHSFY